MPTRSAWRRCFSLHVGPVLRGALTSGSSWRWIFFVNLPIAATAIAITLGRVDESRDPGAGRPDWMGFLTFGAALAALVYGLIESNAHAWGSNVVVGSLVSAAVLLIAFIATELRQPRPIFDLSLLRNPTFVGGLAAAFAIAASLLLVAALIAFAGAALGRALIREQDFVDASAIEAVPDAALAPSAGR